MLFDIQIEKEISRDEVQSYIADSLGLKVEQTLYIDLDFEIPEPGRVVCVLTYVNKPAGFKISMTINTNLIKYKNDIYKLLINLSNKISSNIFIDEGEHNGKLFTPDHKIIESKYDIIDVDDSDCWIIIE